MPILGEVLADRYRIESLLGGGGMSSVYLGLDERLHRKVAVKVLLPSLAGDAVVAQRFEREARALAAVSHPGIVAIYDVEPGDPTSGREPFYVLELCEGGSLHDRLGAAGRLDPPELVATIAAVGAGLAELHRRGIIHRDVKPQNILFTGGRAKLADFGIARHDAAPGLTTLTAPGTAVGTLAYLAPELLDGAPASPASDTYALGAVAFQGLTARLPRPAHSMVELVEARATTVPAASALEPGLGTAFDAPLAAALGLDPAARPAADELGAQLVAALDEWRKAVDSEPEGSRRPPVMVDPTATTVAAIELPVTPPARPTDRERAAGSGARGSRMAAIALAAAVLIVAALLGLNALFGGASPGSSALPSAPVAAQTAPASSSPSPSPSASPSAVPSTSPPYAAALAALDRVDAAISAATGGKDGLKGKTANELQALATDVRSAIAAGDEASARTTATMLAERTAAVTKGMQDARAQELQDAVAALVSALP